MANRGPPPSNGVDGAAAAFARASLGDSAPVTARAHSYPVPSVAAVSRGRGGGLAGKRARPNFKLSDINGGPPGDGGGVGGGAAGAGLGAGRPSLAAESAPRRPPSSFGSPFSNFGKIV